MNSNAQIRQKAREVLLNGWNRYAFVSLITFAAAVLVSELGRYFAQSSAGQNAGGAAGIIGQYVLPIGINVILGLMLSLVFYGLQYYFLKLIRNEHSANTEPVGSTAGMPAIRDLAEAFRRQPDRFLVISIILTAAEWICFLPLRVLIFSIPVTVVWCAAGVLVYLFLYLNIIFATRILFENENLSASAAITKSIRYTRGRKMRLLKMLISFLPMLLLAACSLFIGLIWLIPYVEVSVSEFYIEAVKE